MKTYAETQGKEKINWFDWLEGLKSIQDISKDALGEVLSKAHSAHNWVTCAVGNQCDIIPRDELGRPKDARLSELGNRFSNAMNTLEDDCLDGSLYCFRESVDQAIYILHEIEKRSAEIIAQMEDNSTGN